MKGEGRKGRERKEQEKNRKRIGSPLTNTPLS
jgi:hypothetical protein